MEKNKRIEAVIFDWAGTTVDFGCFAPVYAFIKIFEEAGIDVTIEEARKPMGMLKKDHIKEMLNMARIQKLWIEKYGKEPDKQDMENLYERFEPLLFDSLAEYTKINPDVLDIVKMLREEKIKIGSTTGYTDKMMQIVVKEAEKNGYKPDCWITPDSTGMLGRPYPFMIFRNMEILKIESPLTVLKVGDTQSDIKEGVNAGVWSIGIIIGSSEMGLNEKEYKLLSSDEKNKFIEETKNKFISYGADFTINSMKELPEIIEKINSMLAQGRKPNECKLQFK